MNGLGLDAARGPVIAPKTSMAGASRDAGYLLRFRMASASGRPEYSPLPWATRRRFDPSSSPSATELGSQPLGLVDLAQNTQQTETFSYKDRTGDCRRDGNLLLETAFFSKASYYVILVQFRKVKRESRISR
jgi:hypothetical protein